MKTLNQPPTNLITSLDVSKQLKTPLYRLAYLFRKGVIRPQKIAGRFFWSEADVEIAKKILGKKQICQNKNNQ